MLTTIINLYFIATVYSQKELHTLDYFLITTQSILDLIFSGVLNSAQYIINTITSLVSFCFFSGFTLPAHLQDE